MDILTDWSTWVGAASVAVVTGIGGALAYLKNLGKQDDGKHIVMEAATIADMRPFRDAIKALERLATSAEAIEEILRNTAEEDEIERRVRERLKDRP